MGSLFAAGTVGCARKPRSTSGTYRQPPSRRKTAGIPQEYRRKTTGDRRKPAGKPQEPHMKKCDVKGPRPAETGGKLKGNRRKYTLRNPQENRRADSLHIPPGRRDLHRQITVNTAWEGQGTMQINGCAFVSRGKIYTICRYISKIGTLLGQACCHPLQIDTVLLYDAVLHVQCVWGSRQIACRTWDLSVAAPSGRCFRIRWGGR